MPTPVGTIIDSAQTIADAFVATGAFYQYLSMFVAFAIGVGLAFLLARRVRKMVGR